MIKKLKYKQILYIITLLVSLSSCHHDMARQSPMTLSLYLPAQEYTTQRRRIMGDPGSTEQFALPKYAYIFVMRETNSGWTVWNREERILQDEHWEMTHNTGFRINYGDSIFRYDLNFHFLLQDETPVGRVYAICSNKRLTFSKSLNDITDLDDLLNLKFSTTPDSIQEDLQNIYATPYNYTVNGQYYCSFDCSDGTSTYVDLMLYHVASKVDIKWNVAADKRIDNETPANGVRLTYMGVRRLYNGDAYCFKPMRNTLPSLPSSGGYDLPDIVTESDEGLWWEGRTYFYTIPYTAAGAPECFPVQMVLRTNGITSGTGYELTLKQAIDTANVFVPWMRGNFNLSKALGNTSAEKVTD